MSVEIQKWADHLRVLHAYSRGLLDALYCAKHAIGAHELSPISFPYVDLVSKGGSPEVTYAYNGTPLTPASSARPALDKIKILSDQGLTEIFKKMMKKFPEVVEFHKDSKYQAFSNAQRSLLEELRSYYDVLVAGMEFTDLSLVILQQSINLVNLSFDINPDLANAFLDLLVAHISVAYMMASIGQEKKLLASAYSKAWQIDHGQQEPNYNRLAKHMLAYEKPLAVIQESLSTLAPKILALLMEIKPDLDQRLCMTADNFRKMAILSLTPEMSGIKAPEPDEKQLRGLANMNRQYSILILGFLVCSSELGKQPGCVDILKQALTYGYAMPLVRNDIFNILGEYEQSSKTHKKLAYLKGTVSDTLTLTATTAPHFHKDRRDYLRHQIRQMLCLCGDYRILCTKFAMVASAIGFARDEILWYFYHLDHDINGKKKGKRDPKTLDVGVVELIWLMKELAKSIRSNVEVIREHFANQIVQFYAPNLLQLIENALGPDIEKEGVGILLQEIHKLLNMFTNGQLDGLLESGGLEALRMNWLRFQVAAALPSSGGIANISDITWLMTDLCERSKWLDQFDERLEQLCSLRDLCFYQSALHEHLKDCLDTNLEFVRYAGAFGHLAEEFVSNVSAAWPAEEKHIIAHSTAFATELYSIIGQYAANLAHDSALFIINYHNQTLSQEAVALLHKATGADKNKKARKHLADRPVVKPGWESNLNTIDAGTRSLERQKQLLRNLLFALTNPISTTVYDSEFHPFEFFMESLADKFHSYMMSCVFKPHEAASSSAFPSFGSNNAGDEGLSFDVKRPSVLLNELHAYLTALRFIDCLVPTHCTSGIKEILLGQLSLSAARQYAEAQPDQMVFPVASKDPKKLTREKNKSSPMANASLPVVYMAWYSELLGTKATSGTVCYSVNRRAFLSRNHLLFQAETYTDLNELCALCELIGPQGVRFIDEKLTSMLASLTNATKELSSQYQSQLEALKSCWADESKSIDVLKRFRNIKDFSSKLINLGFILEFRVLLAQAVQQVFNQACTHIHACISTAHTHYPPNKTCQRPYKAVDGLANDIGLVNRVDVRMRAALSTVIGGPSDAGLWSLLPYLCTAMLWNLAFDDSATYNSYIDGLENNGHCLASAFLALFAHSTPASVAAGYGPEREFLHVACTTLMRLLQRAGDKELQAKNLSAAFLVLKRFVHQSNAISAGIAEAVIPYALFQALIGGLHRSRMEAINLHHKRAGGGTAATAEEEVAF